MLYVLLMSSWAKDVGVHARFVEHPANGNEEGYIVSSNPIIVWL